MSSTHIVLEEPKVAALGKARRRLAPGARSWSRRARQASAIPRRLGYPIYRYLASPAEMAASISAITEVTLKDAQKLPAGSVLMFKFGSSPAMLIHHQDGSWVALSAVCTHLGCTVQYEPQMNRIHCACHGGVYDPRTGSNVSGPPPKPLKLFKVAVNDAGVEVSRA